jgi:hypothetical protein
VCVCVCVCVCGVCVCRCDDRISVTSDPSAMLKWMMLLSHVEELLPPRDKRATMTLVTALSNDGTNLRDKKSHRSVHAMLLRILSLGRAAQSCDFICPLSLHEMTESGVSMLPGMLLATHSCLSCYSPPFAACYAAQHTGETFLEMFVNDRTYADGFESFFANTFGFKKHLCLLIAECVLLSTPLHNTSACTHVSCTSLHACTAHS